MRTPGLIRRLTRRLMAPPLIALALILVLLDATLWRWFAALGRVLARLPLFAALEHMVERLSPRAVIAVFVLPFIPLIPLLKFAELWLLHNRHYAWAALLIVGGKVFGVAFSTRVFAIAKPKMLQVRWFARAYGGVTRLLDLGHRTLEAIPAWVAARALGRRVVAQVRAAVALVWRTLRPGTGGTLGRRLEAALRWARRRPAR